MKIPRLAILLALCLLPAVHAQAQYNPALAGFLSRILGQRAAGLSLTRSTPAGDVSIQASVSPSGATYSATMTAPSGASVAVSGTATSLSPAGGSFSGTITRSQGPSANYTGSIATSPNSVEVAASITPAGDDAGSPPPPPSQVAVRVSTPAGAPSPNSSFAGSVSAPPGPAANFFGGSFSDGSGSVEVSASFTPAGGATTTRTVTFTPPAASEENEESPLQRVLQKLGVIRPRG